MCLQGEPRTGLLNTVSLEVRMVHGIRMVQKASHVRLPPESPRGIRGVHRQGAALPARAPGVPHVPDTGAGPFGGDVSELLDGRLFEVSSVLPLSMWFLNCGWPRMWSCGPIRTLDLSQLHPCCIVGRFAG